MNPTEKLREALSNLLDASYEVSDQAMTEARREAYRALVASEGTQDPEELSSKLDTARQALRTIRAEANLEHPLSCARIANQAAVALEDTR